jgi:ABC-2 type transport system permease protein
VKIISLVKAEIVMLIGELKEYSLNMIFYNLSLLILFVGIFYSFNNGIQRESLALLFGLITWQLSSSALNYMSYVVQDESLLGTLEQIFMTRTSIFSVFTSKIIVNFIFSIIKATLIFLICLFIFHAQDTFFNLGILNLHIITIILFTVLSFYMMGLMFGGIALFFKRVDSVVQVITYILLFFTNITIPIESLPEVIKPISYCIPISWEMNCIKLILENNTSSNVYYTNLIGLIISSMVFILIGCLSFNKCIKKAKNMGKLGQY